MLRLYTHIRQNAMDSTDIFTCSCYLLVRHTPCLRRSTVEYVNGADHTRMLSCYYKLEYRKCIAHKHSFSTRTVHCFSALLQKQAIGQQKVYEKFSDFVTIETACYISTAGLSDICLKTDGHQCRSLWSHT